MNLQMLGFDGPLLIHQMLDLSEEMEGGGSAQMGAYVAGDAGAAAPTSADVTEYRNSYAFVVDVPGLKSGEIEVKVEEGGVLAICGQRKWDEATEGANYVRTERRVGKFLRKFSLPEDANTDAVSAACQDGVLTVTMKKMSPPEPKAVEVKTA